MHLCHPLSPRFETHAHGLRTLVHARCQHISAHATQSTHKQGSTQHRDNGAAKTRAHSVCVLTEDEDAVKLAPSITTTEHTRDTQWL